MRKVIAIMATFALAFALTGCVTQVTKGNSKSMSATADAGVSASASASSASASASASSSAQSSSSAAVNWTAANTDDAAAKGAGLDRFGVPARTVIADFVFVNPTFAYTQNVAQATYEVAGSAKLVVRKAQGAHTVAVTEPEKAALAQSWQNTYEGFDVTSCGDTQGAATICLWNDGTKEYGVSIEGLGGSKVTMSAEDVDDIVKAVKSAEAIQTTQDVQQTAAEASKSPAFDPKQAVSDNGLGEYVSYYYVQGDDGKDYWALVTHDADGKEYTTYVDAQGKPINKMLEVGDVADGGIDPEKVALDNGLGQYVTTYSVELPDTFCWAIVTKAADGSQVTTYVDIDGNVIPDQSEFARQDVYANTAASAGTIDPESVAFQYGLGQLDTYYYVQGEDGTGYWALVTTGADGAQYTTYVDVYGNVIQGGDVEVGSIADVDASYDAYADTTGQEQQAGQEQPAAN